MGLQDEYGAVRRERVLPVARDAAWELLGEPDALADWLADEVELDAVRAGEEGVLRWDDGEERRVVVEEVVPGRRVAMRWDDPAGGPGAVASLVELTLDDAGEDGHTVLRVVELPLVALRAVASALHPAAAGGPAGPVALAA